MENVCKKWDKEEDDQLLNEINRLDDITKICNVHKRKIGGIQARIKKLIEDKEYSKKLNDKTEVLKKYSTDEFDNYKNLVNEIKTKIQTYVCVKDIAKAHNISQSYVLKILYNLQKFNKDLNIKTLEKINSLINSHEKFNLKPIDKHKKDIIDNIKNYSSIDDIIEEFEELKESDVMEILKEYILSPNPNSNKKDKIKSIFKKYKIQRKNKKTKDSDDSCESEENIIHKTTKNNKETNSNIDLVKNLYDDMQLVKIDIKSIKKDIEFIKKFLIENKSNDNSETSHISITKNNKNYNCAKKIHEKYSKYQNKKEKKSKKYITDDNTSDSTNLTLVNSSNYSSDYEESNKSEISEEDLEKELLNYQN